MVQILDGLVSVAQIRRIELPRHARANGELVMAEAGTHVPFPIVRLFTVTAPAGARRGEHAHRRCTQFMLCVRGAVEIGCDDGDTRKTFMLDRANVALCVPPSIWNTIDFRAIDSALVVLCDRPFEEADYIRSYPDFLAFREGIVL
jgi:hypothetical protein